MIYNIDGLNAFCLLLSSLWRSPLVLYTASVCAWAATVFSVYIGKSDAHHNLCVHRVWCAAITVYHFPWLPHTHSHRDVCEIAVRLDCWCSLFMQNIINIYQFIIISLENVTIRPSERARLLWIHICSMATIHKMSACNLVNPSCK